MTGRPSFQPRRDAGYERDERDTAPRAHSPLAAQWAALLLAPATFFAHLQVAYILVPWTCAGGSAVWLHVAGALSVLLAATGVAIGLGVWSREGRGVPGEHGGPEPRARFLGVVGAVTSAVFVLLLAGQWAAAFILSPCQ